MDIESDESERWEDFFGSSTDLSPSLIGYYDNLSNNFISSPTTNSADLKSKSPTRPPPHDRSKSSSPNKICNIKLLSPTVQRMIFHSGSMKDEQLKKKSSQENSNSTIGNSKFYVNVSHKSTPVKSSTAIAGGKKLNLPLSKLTKQLSLSSNELLDGNNSGGGHDIGEYKNKTDNCLEEVTENNHSFLFDHLNSRGSSVLETSFDNDNSTDNNNNNNSNDHHEPDNESLLSNHSFLTKQMSSVSSSLNLNPTDTEDDEEDDERYHDASNFFVNLPDNLPKSIICEAKNSSLHEKYADQTDARVKPTAIFYRDSENNNNNNNSNSTSVNDSSVSNNSNQFFVNKALHIVETNSWNRPNEPANMDVNTTNDKTISNSNNSNSNNSNNNNNANLLKLKSDKVSDLQTKQHRPLSATSITSSTSSSSSSSSENHLASKHGVSYLASVESLAEHSEGELNVNCYSNLTVTEKLVLEIVATEKSYVEDIRQTIQGYLEDWKERACLKEEELKILFSNITEIYECNTLLLKELINSGTDPDQIAKCFIDLKDKFDVYTTYCTSYLEAISLLTQLAKASHTNALLVSTQKLLKHRLGLGSYLLKPVQRILKYHLLLENLRKHNDTENIRRAHELMREVAHHIDQVKKSLEQQSRVKELSGILDGWLGPELTVLGELRHEGILMESNKPRIVLLFATMLIITKRKEDGRLQCKTYIHHKHLMLIEHINGEPTSFNVLPYTEPRNLIKLTAKNRDSKRLWAQQIKQVMLENFNIPDRAKELVFKLGDEEERTPDKNTWKWGHSSTPEYLERRNQYRRSEMRYRSKKARKNLVQSTKSLDDNFIKLKSTSTQSLVNSSNDLSLIGGSITSINNCSIHSSDHHQHHTDHHHDHDCNCHNVKTQLTDTLKSSRSKSETRVPLNFYKIHTLNRSQASATAQQTPTPQPTDSAKDDLSYEVKMYNKKNIPKRIEKIKKSRSKSLKENSTFYMELKITESSDNIPNEVHNEMENNDRIDDSTDKGHIDEHDSLVTDNQENKNDTQIITELLKENKDFDRLLSCGGQPKKPQKHKKLNEISNEIRTQLNSIMEKNSMSCSSSLSNISTAQQGFDANIELVKKQAERILKLNEIEMDLTNQKPEPIYESLKRNVHVPYKYCPSPNLQRSKSQPYPNTQAIKVKKVERPDSDYVTLDYNAVIHYNQSLSNSSTTSNSAPISSTASTNSVNIMKLRNSDSNINYTNNSMGKLNKLSERRVSDVIELCRQSVIYKQGSENLGSRIAHLDYADPKTLLASAQSQCNILINKNLLKSNQERDSVVSLTSSNDSVNNNHSGGSPPNNRSTGSLSHHDSYYEDKIEELLENDNIRDSAIYSDDNVDKKFNSVIKSKSLTIDSTPPPLPAKPNKLLSKYDRSISEGGALKNNVGNNCNSNNSDENDIENGDNNKSSWVLQQIKNFNSCK